MRKSVRLASLLLALVMCGGLLAACGGDDSSVSFVSIPEPSVPVSSPPPVSSLPSEPVSSEPPIISEPAPSSSSVVASSSTIPAQPAPQFTDNTPLVVSVASRRVTVSYKTNVPSTVNAILSNRGNSVSTNAFYDYTRRGVALEGAILHKSTYNVTSAGVTETFDLPDTSVPYYLIVNAVENQTGTWQSTTTQIVLYNPSVDAPQFSAVPIRQADTADNYVWLVETNSVIRVWALVVATGSAAPTSQQVRDNQYPGTAYGHYSLDTAGTQAPYTATFNLPKNTLGAGNYSIWFVAQQANTPTAPISTAVEVTLTVS